MFGIAPPSTAVAPPAASRAFTIPPVPLAPPATSAPPPPPLPPEPLVVATHCPSTSIVPAPHVAPAETELPPHATTAMHAMAAVVLRVTQVRVARQSPPYNIEGRARELLEIKAHRTW